MSSLHLLRLVTVQLTRKEEVMNQEEIEKIIENDETEMCENCGNAFKVELVKEGENWNDFGYRHCPFCGEMTDEYAVMYEKLKERRIKREQVKQINR